MKNLLVLALTFFVTMGLNAQDVKGDFKDAKSLLNKYKLDNSNVDGLSEAAGLMDNVLKDDEYSSDPKVLMIAAEIYESMLNNDIQNMSLKVIDKPKFPDAAMKAVGIYEMVYDKADKKWRKKEAMEKLAKNAAFLNQFGYAEYQAGNYGEAFAVFEKGLDIHEMLVDEGEDGVYQTDSAYQNQIFISSAMATQAGENEKAEMYLNKLVDMNYQDPVVYNNLYTLYKDTDEEKALNYLTEGREKFPDNVNLLFSEINHYLSEGKLDVLVGKLEKAIEAEPENASVRSTLGSVYDQLYQQEVEKGNDEKAQEYFDNALDYYNQSLELDPQSVEAQYSIGALYYNKAASMVEELNKLADDYSTEGTKKYNAKKVEVDAAFDKALPFFEKAYEINPKDKNTLIALREIYVRKDMLEKATDIKKQLESL